MRPFFSLSMVVMNWVSMVDLFVVHLAVFSFVGVANMEFKLEYFTINL